MFGNFAWEFLKWAFPLVTIVKCLELMIKTEFSEMVWDIEKKHFSTLIPITLGVKERLISVFNDHVICLHVVSCRTYITFDKRLPHKCCMAKWQALWTQDRTFRACRLGFALDLHVVSFFGTWLSQSLPVCKWVPVNLFHTGCRLTETDGDTTVWYFLRLIFFILTLL